MQAGRHRVSGPGGLRLGGHGAEQVTELGVFMELGVIELRGHKAGKDMA